VPDDGQQRDKPYQGVGGIGGAPDRHGFAARVEDLAAKSTERRDGPDLLRVVRARLLGGEEIGVVRGRAHDEQHDQRDPRRHHDPLAPQRQPDQRAGARQHLHRATLA